MSKELLISINCFGAIGVLGNLRIFASEAMQSGCAKDIYEIDLRMEFVKEGR